ncbi:MAG: transporter substrate-binding domain-containing protein [Magnetococcales bacterium]|nr:transporter substrate-binding domain-containing protein [Magnetococcales bacterium]
MGRVLLFITVTFALFAVGSSRGYAQELKYALLEWPPHTSQYMEGYGVASELVTAVTKEMNLEPKYNFYPLKRVFHYLEEGSHWAAFPGSYTKERAKKFIYSDPIFPQVDRFFYYKNKPKTKFTKLGDLKQYVIGGTKGFWYEKEFKRAKLQTYYVSSDVIALKMLVGGRVNLVAIHELVGWQLIKKHFPDEVDNFGVLEKPLKVKENYLLASRTYPESELLIKRFNLALQKIKTNGTYKNIAGKYNLQQ